MQRLVPKTERPPIALIRRGAWYGLVPVVKNDDHGVRLIDSKGRVLVVRVTP